MIHLTIDKRYQPINIDGMVIKAAETALKNQGVSLQADLSVVITGDQKLKKLNTQFRGKKHTTDVLSFPSGEFNDGKGHGYLGDVIISLPRARAQAKAGGHNLYEELQLLTVHGILHLLGHDHGDAQEEARMWAAQDEILNKLGVSIHSPATESPNLAP